MDAVDEYSLHSPFFFNLYSNAIKKKSADTAFATIEKLRSTLLADHDAIEVTDLGAGSSFTNSSRRTIGSIARTSVTPRKYSQLYRRIIDYFGYQNILELGTSLGINTLYLASRPGSRVATLEGSVAIADKARELFASASVTNIELITGNIDRTLPEYLQHNERLDFVLIDANHRYIPTLNYFNVLLPNLHPQSVVVLDDIHYSGEMERAWNDIRHHRSVFATADLFRCGLVFFDPSINRQHHVLQF